MDLNSILSKIPIIGVKQADNEFYFALNIQESQVEGAVWGIEGKRLKIINSAQTHFSRHGQLTDAANHVLDVALGDFFPEPTKVLFGVPDSWLQDDNLKEEYLKLLRHLVRELDISPMAYVSSTHAVAHSIQKQTGVPTTAILVEVEDPINVAVVKAGKIVGTKAVKREKEIADDIAKGLASFHDVEVLPSKIVLYGDSEENLEKFKDKLQSFQWIPRLPFLHLPKIEMIEKNILIKALCLAGASGINPDVVYPSGEVALMLEDTQGRPVHRKLPEESLAEVGFVAGDIEDRVSHRTAVDKDEVVLRERHHMQEYNHHPQGSQGVPIPIPGFLANMIDRIKGFLPEPKSGGALNRGGFSSNLKFIIPAVVLVLFLAGFFVLPKANVEVLIDPKVLEQDAQVVVDPNLKEINEAEKRIPGKLVEIQETGTEKAAATGKRQIGDPAKGSVNLYNLTSSKVTLNSGTVLTSDKGYKFTLDTSAQIASQSSSIGADFTTVTTPGKAASAVSASAIGPDSNLPAGTELSVAGFNKSQVVAKVENALSGGTSKDVTVVTADDQKKLLAALSSALREKAQQDLQSKLEPGQKVLAEGLIEKITKQQFNKAVNDQASEFSLNLSANYTGTSYSDQDLKQIVSKLIITNVPEGYELSLEDSETQAGVGRLEKDGRLIFNAKFKAKLIPKLNQDQIKQDIKGKSIPEAEEKLKTLGNVIGANIVIKPSLPGPLARIPFLTNNITLEIKPK